MCLRFGCSLSIILLMFRLIQSLAFKTLPFFGGQLDFSYIRITRYQGSRLLDASGHVKVKPLLFPTKCDDDSPDMDFQKCIFKSVYFTAGSDEYVTVTQSVITQVSIVYF